MDTQLPIKIEPQPDDTTCGPTCLQAVYRYYGESLSLKEVIDDTQTLSAGGTLDVFLANHALQRGYRATIYTYNLQMFDPSWFTSRKVVLQEKLKQQAQIKADEKLQYATQGYLEFLSLGGKLRYTDLNSRLIRNILRQQLPILTGLSSTYLYRASRVFGPDDQYDDIRGEACGHFVVLAGYQRKGRLVQIADPYLLNPLSEGQLYQVNIDRVICAIMLGVLTYDANLLIIHPRN